MRTIARLFAGVLGFVVVALLVLVLEGLLLALISELLDRQIIPRGLGFIAVPIMAGVAGFAFAQRFVTDQAFRARTMAPLKSALKLFSRGNVFNRICLALALAFAVVAHIVFMQIEDADLEYLYGWRFEEMLTFIWLPTAATLLAPVALAWARRPPKKPSDGPSAPTE